ncbi:MAG: AMP-binding protein [Candidatus Limnocylindria bacterium]
MSNLLEVIDASAARFARQPALLIKPGFRTRRWRYRQLPDLVARVAAVFAADGVKQGDRVVIWAVNRPEWGIAFLGALHAGAVLVPLDVRSQTDLARKVVEHTRARLVIASVQTLDLAKSLGLPILMIESLPDLARDQTPLPRAAIGADDLAEVMFTSGTTGEPKGVMLTHGNVLSNATALVEVFPLGPRQRLLSVLPLSHMFEQTCGLLAPLLAGASVAYPMSRQPSVLVRAFRDYGITMILLVPQALRLLDNAIERQVDASGRRRSFERLHRLARRLPMRLRRLLFLPVHRGFGGRLRFIAVGGAALDAELGRRWEEMGMQVLQGYGATECSPVISFTRTNANRLGTVGRAVPGMQVTIASDGEILVRGASVFPGYWEEPSATQAVLRDGWYATGDLGELSSDGFLTLRGRKKDMIVLADGTNVFPEDIENVLAHDDRLRDAVVVGRERLGEGMQIHAVLLPADVTAATDGNAIDGEAIVRDANARLSPSQQIRAHSVWPDEDFPRTHTLKVKKRLVVDRLEMLERQSGREVTADERPHATQAARPAVSVESVVASVAGVSVDQVHDHSRLSSDLGLDSLARIELLSVIEEELGAFVDDAAVDPEATVADVRALVDGATGQPRETGIYGWPLSPVAGSVRIALQQLLLAPFLMVFYRTRVSGRHHLSGLAGPVLFTPNHWLHFDNAIILTCMPLAWRWRLSVAAAKDDVFGSQLRGFVAGLVGNAFPLAREGAVRRSLELLGARLDRDFSVLVYPEGKLTLGGPMQPFKSGTGLVAVDGATPVVPMKLKINRMSVIDQRGAPWRGDVELIFGRPLVFPVGTNYEAATEQIREAVEAL